MLRAAVTAPLAELDVLVVDCQATGATPAHGSLLEMGWTVVRSGGAAEQVHAHTIALPPGLRIPRVIRELTGLDAAGLGDSVPAEVAWRSLLARTSGVQRTDGGRVPTVIHFAQFELRFLRDLHARVEPSVPFPLEVVCAHEIARRLFPTLPRRGLRALAGYLGHGLHLERRSRGHVEATAFVWRRLAAELAARDLGGWEDVVGWLAATPAPPSSARRMYPMPRERRLGLPDEPGVYRLLRSNGDVLYVGKATSLKKRVASHFTRGSRADERALEMLTQAQGIDVTVTSTAVEAALLETDEIKRLDPPYNVQLRELDRAAWFVTRELDDPAAAPDATRPMGPLPSRHALSGLAAIRSLLSGVTPTPSVRARATGVPLAFGPSEDELAAGLASFVERHVDAVRSRTRAGALLKASKALWRLAAARVLDDGERDADPMRAWDADRVRRHLERSALSGGQLLRRARWLTILGDATVAWREPVRSRWRALVLHHGEIVAREDLSTSDALPPPPDSRRAWRDRQASFDAVRYDRLRVLATELKRVLAEGGEVAVRVDENRMISGTRLTRMLEGT